MPCYEAPPPWEGAARRSGETAVRLLCELCLTHFQNNTLQDHPELLNWYIKHREIDLRIATTTGGYIPPDPAQARYITSQLVKLRALQDALKQKPKV